MAIYGTSGGVPLLGFEELGNLGKTYREGEDRRTLASLGEKLANEDINYRQAAAMAAKTGKLDVALSLLKLGEDKAAQQAYSRDLGGILGAPQPGSNQPTQPQAQPSPMTVPGAAPPGMSPGAWPGAPQAQPQQPQAPNNNPYGGAIASIESGGKYDALGPVTKTGDRAFGKYQVMGSNIGPWTREILGREMTPQEFLSNPQAQDAVFQARFGQYVQKYGPTGASKAWFAGEKGMLNPNAQDQLGTTVQGYADKFTRALGPQPQQPNASAPISLAQLGQQPTNDAIPPGAPPPPPQWNPQQAQTLPQAQPGSQPSGRPNPIGQNVPALMYILSHPGARPEQRKAAEIALTEALKTPDNIREYNLYEQQERGNGRQPMPFMDFAIQLKKAQAQPPAETEENKLLGHGAGTRANTLMASATAAPKSLADINRAEALLARVDQGKIQPARLTVSAWAKSLGLPDGTAEALGLDPKAVGDAQALQALTSKSVISMIGAGGFPANNFSDADRQFLIGTLQQISNEPGANKIILETGRRVIQADIDKAKAWMEFRRDPQNKGKSFDDFDITWVDKISKQDRFGDLRKQAEEIIGPPKTPGQPTGTQQPGAQPKTQTAAAQPASKADYDALPSGTRYVAPDGSERVKP